MTSRSAGSRMSTSSTAEPRRAGSCGAMRPVIAMTVVLEALGGRGTRIEAPGGSSGATNSRAPFPGSGTACGTEAPNEQARRRQW